MICIYLNKIANKHLELPKNKIIKNRQVLVCLRRIFEISCKAIFVDLA